MSRLFLNASLDLDSCPHCGRAHPTITLPNNQPHWIRFKGALGNEHMWGVYACTTCGNLVLAKAIGQAASPVIAVYPAPKSVAEELPDEPKRFLEEAVTCLHAPSAAILCCASAVDAMLKAKGYEKGWLKDRVNEAVAKGLLTEEMGTWAHHIRLEANDQRHADKNAKPPTREDAEQSIEFTEALGEILVRTAKQSETRNRARQSY
jgi:Domain of unknown function (DUF4145)